MQPTKKNIGEFWWLHEGSGDPVVVEIRLKYGTTDKLQALFPGWDTPAEVDALSEDCKWLGRAVPPEVKDD